MSLQGNLFRILNIIILTLTIYYLNNLEDETCKCVRDWRHNFIKYTSILNIILFVIIYINEKVLSKISNIMTFISIIILITFISYIRDLETTKCECAIAKQKDLYNILYYYNYILAFVVVILVSIIILGSFVEKIAKK